MTGVRLGGTASDVVIYNVGFGLMRLTLTTTPVDDETAFAIIKSAIDLVPVDQKLFLNSAEFYGLAPREANLLLLKRFFTKYPELADRAFLSVKGSADCSLAGLRRTVDTCLKALGGAKKIDLFESARVDPNTPIEEAVRNMAQLVSEGKFDHIGLSECAAKTVRRANSAHPIAAVEIEVSPLAYESETKAVLEATEELGIAVIAYGSIAFGALASGFSKDQLPTNDFRRQFSKFQDEALAHNQRIVDVLEGIAKRKKVTTTQVSLAWVKSLGPQVVPLPGTTKLERVKENSDAGILNLTPEEVKEVFDAIEIHGIKGGRYLGGNSGANNMLWG